MSSDIEFVQGLICKRNEKAPDFLICSLSIKRDELIQWLQDRDGEWVNVDIKNSKAGKMYAAVNNFKPRGGDEAPAPKAKAASKPTGRQPDPNDDLPF